jgi:DHA2 family multidrug resistance protein
MTSIGMAATMMFTPSTDYSTFVMYRILQVVGLPFLFVPTSTMAFSAIPKEKSGKASALYSLMRNLGGSFGISLVLSFLARREQEHQNFLSQHFAKTDTNYQSAIASSTQAIMDLGHPHAAAAATAAGRMYQQLITQATLLSYSDAYEVFAIIVGVLAIVALFLPPNQKRQPSPDQVAPAH